MPSEMLRHNVSLAVTNGVRVGELRGGLMGLPTDRSFTDQRAEGSLLDYNARYYSPLLGRFISADSIVPRPGNPQSLNRYGYSLNSPLRYRDPSGHDFEDAAAFLTGVLYGWGSANGSAFGASLMSEQARREADALTVQSSDFAVGRVLGDVIAAAQGAGEITTGLGGFAAGGVLCFTGIGCFGGAGAIAVSSVLVIHGGVAVSNGLADAVAVFAKTNLGNEVRQPNAQHPPNSEAAKRLSQIKVDSYTDCTSEAEGIQAAAGGEGRIVRVQYPGATRPGGYMNPSAKWIQIPEQGRLQEYVYHDVFTDGRYVYDPFWGPDPIPYGDWERVIDGLNPGVTIK